MSAWPGAPVQDMTLSPGSLPALAAAMLGPERAAEALAPHGDEATRRCIGCGCWSERETCGGCRNPGPVSRGAWVGQGATCEGASCGRRARSGNGGGALCLWHLRNGPLKVMPACEVQGCGRRPYAKDGREKSVCLAHWQARRRPA